MSTGKFPEGWVSPQLDEIATDINYGYTASSTSENIGPKMLRITDIQDNKVDWNSVPFCKIEDNQKINIYFVTAILYSHEQGLLLVKVS